MVILGHRASCTNRQLGNKDANETTMLHHGTSVFRIFRNIRRPRQKFLGRRSVASGKAGLNFEKIPNETRRMNGIQKFLGPLAMSVYFDDSTPSQKINHCNAIDKICE